MKVVIAEDSLLVCARLVTMLAEFKQVEVVGHAQNGHDAILLIRTLKPDVVILDIQMARGSGIDVLEQSKKEQPSLVAIMLSNHSTPHHRAKCLEAGANFFFDKSTEFMVLQELFAEMILHAHRLPLFDWTNKKLQRFSE